MTETDWVELVGKIRGYVDPWRAEELLRTHILAAFVPVDRYTAATEAAATFVDQRAKAAARAEAAEARVKVLEEALRAVLPYTEAERLAEASAVRLGAHRDPINKAVLRARQALGAEHGK